jgi:hypothetical protein
VEATLPSIEGAPCRVGGSVEAHQPPASAACCSPPARDGCRSSVYSSWRSGRPGSRSAHVCIQSARFSGRVARIRGPGVHASAKGSRMPRQTGRNEYGTTSTDGRRPFVGASASEDHWSAAGPRTREPESLAW